MVNTPSPPARASGPVRVLAAGAAKTVVLELAGPFEAQSGQRLDASFDTVGALRDRVLAGELADVTILSAQALESVTSRGFGKGPLLDLGSAGVALGGRAGTTFPRIDTADIFRQVLTGAESIGYADPERGATAGRHFTVVLERLNLSGVLRSRLRKFPFGVDAVAALARGEIDIAVSQATEILTQPDVAYLGAFPEPHDLSTAYGAVALSDTDGARAFMSLLAGEAAAASLRRSGFA
jgi:molybdate transport system substrate-binding protein